MAATTLQRVTSALDKVSLNAPSCPQPTAPSSICSCSSEDSCNNNSASSSASSTTSGLPTESESEEPVEPPECGTQVPNRISTSKFAQALAVLHPSIIDISCCAEDEPTSHHHDEQPSPSSLRRGGAPKQLRKKGLLNFLRQIFSPKQQYHDDNNELESTIDKKRAIFHYGNFENDHLHPLVSKMLEKLPDSPSSDSLDISNTELNNLNEFKNSSKELKNLNDSANDSNDSANNSDDSANNSNSSNNSHVVDFTQIPLLKTMQGLRCKFDFSGGKVIGKGGSGTVRLVKSPCCDKVYAVKSFKKRKKKETESDFVKRITLEYLIGSSMHHPNIAETIDMIRKGSHWYQIMPFYNEGDLYSIIKTNQMTDECIDCVFKQLILGVAFMHSKGIAHRDLKPENLLMDSNGFVKITDFGISDLFIANSESSVSGETSSSTSVVPIIHKSKGLSGSTPYIAPEEFTNEEFDPRAVDVWSCAVIFYAMTFHGIPWEIASDKDPEYCRYVANRKLTEEPFVRFASGPQHLLFKMLDPDPNTRITIEEILQNSWFKEIKLCVEYPKPFSSLLSQSNCSCCLDDMTCICTGEKVQHFHFSSNRASCQ